MSDQSLGTSPANCVLHVITSNQRRGAEMVAWSLTKELTGRHDLVALSPGQEPPFLDVPTLGPSALHPATLLRLRRRAANARAVVAHGSRTLPASALALAGLPMPLIYVNIGDPRYWATSPLRRLRMRALYRRTVRVAALGENAADVLALDFGVPPDCIRVVGQGRRVADYPLAGPAERGAARQRLGIGRDDLVVMCLGALSPEKRIDVLIEAMRYVPDAVLLVVGDGPLREELERHAGSVLGDRARFLGLVEQPGLALAAANVLAMTSDTEGLPGVCIEAALTGLPVVATDVGFLRDIVDHGRTGFLVPTQDPKATGEAIRQAITGGARLGAAARRHCAERYDLDRVIERWERLLGEVVDRPTPCSAR